MASFLLERSLTGLSAIDEQGQAVLHGYKVGELIRVRTTRIRNPQHHRLFFALLNLVFENQNRYSNVEHLLIALKIALGHCETVICADGTVAHIPKSISFARMDQDEFNIFFEKAADLLCEHWLPGVKSEDLRQKVLEMVK